MDRSTCWVCGVSFQSPRFLVLHQSKGCGGESDYSDDENDAWCGLVNQAYKENDGIYGEKMEALGDTSDAEDQVVNELRPKYLKSLTKGYKKIDEQFHSLNRNSTHNDIMKTIAWYECRGYDFEKALKIVLRKKRHLLQEILDGFLDDNSDEEVSDKASSDGRETDTEGSVTDEEEDDDDDEVSEVDDEDVGESRRGAGIVNKSVIIKCVKPEVQVTIDQAAAKLGYKYE
jgi:hypothetical protein